MAHWKQIFDTGKFEAFNYGSSKENMIHYGQSTPPLYDLSQIRVPVRLFGGTSD